MTAAVNCFLIIHLTIVQLLFLPVKNSGAEANKDVCAVCMQESQNCIHVIHLYTRTQLGTGLHPIAEIPANACQINITENDLSSNYITLWSKSGKNILNSHWDTQIPGYYEGIGTFFNYSKSSGSSCPGDCIFSKGPTNESILIQLMYQHHNPGITYEFFISKLTDKNYVQQQELSLYPHQRHKEYSEQRDPLEKTWPQYQRKRFVHLQHVGEEQKDKNNRKQYHTPVLLEQKQRQHLTIGSPLHDHEYSPTVSNNPQLLSHHRSYLLAVNAPSRQRFIVERGRGRGRFPVGKRFDKSSLLHIPHKTRWYLFNHKQSRNTSPTPNLNLGHNVNHIYYPVSKVENTEQRENYVWSISGFTECSQSCGGGNQETIVVCVKKNSQVTVTGENCEGSIQPETQQVSCNNIPCPPSWVLGEWSSCSTTCGSGIQARRVECKKKVSKDLHISVSADLCNERGKPAIVQQCGNDPCASWLVGAWSKCSAVCGLGKRLRSVQCVSSEGIQIPDSFCLEPHPQDEEICHAEVCKRQWFMSMWSDKCSSSCGSGVMTRQIVCATYEGKKVPDGLCPDEDRPSDRRSCQSELPCGGTWFVGSWSKCSTSCSGGVRTRNVLCMKKHGVHLLHVVSNDNCLDAEKPSSEEPCYHEICGTQWYMADWSACSSSCGPGIKTRVVKCIDQHHSLSEGCDILSMPATRQNCELEKCDGYAVTGSVPFCRNVYQNCRLVVQARLCKYPFYRGICCASCSESSS